jgi:superfamily II DNA or RNA helicase/SAM-dependent methyltransferase
MQAPDLLDRLHAVVRETPPRGLAANDVDAFVQRNRAVLLALIAERLADREPDLWTPAKRTKANLAAMEVLARGVSASEDRRLLARYSGWGGLSLRPSVRAKFPNGVPIPDKAGLVHEYYTPTRVAREVARVLRPFLEAMDTPIRALEPSAGIGRFVRAFRQVDIDWTAIETSPLSARMLGALRPKLTLHEGSFESWVTQHRDDRFDLVIANPPYGPRGLHITEDPDRRYRQKQAWAYFLLRCLDLLRPDGIGAFVIPSGFLRGKTHRRLRERVLRSHHLMSAYRLPSGLFPGAEIVTDLLFFRARGGALPEVDAADETIVHGRYFELYPNHLLGTEVPGRRYRVEGTFERLPDLVERPICAVCVVPPPAPKPKTTRTQKPTELPNDVDVAIALGERVDRYLALPAREQAPRWAELHRALIDWVDAHGNPNRHLTLKRSKQPGAQRFLACFQPGGRVIDGLSHPPSVPTTFTGRADDVLAQAETLYRAERTLSVSRLLAFHRKQGGRLRTPTQVVDAITDAGWALDGDQLLPMADYCSGHLWPRVDRAKRAAEGGDVLYADQLKQLLEVIQPAVFEDIEGVSPRQGWVPLDLVAGWMTDTLNPRYGRVELVREDGLVQVKGVDYDDIDGSNLSPEGRWCVGWMNHDKTVFKPRKRRHENIDEIRLALGKQWERSFRDWCLQDVERQTRIEEAYNRAFRGYVPQRFSAEPLSIARWGDSIRLHPHQAAAARRLLHHRGGLLAFDVGVGKTYTGIAVLARARQEGWCRRPVILVPNSIVWKWAADIERVLPDYRVAVVGSNQVIVKRGERKGELTSVTDSPEDRAAKWTRFQAGDVDVVLLTYSALARTELNADAVTRYAERTEAIQREVRLRKRNAGNAKKLTERQEAVLAEGVKAWVAEMLELPESWKPDPGIRWDELGIDLLIVDEAQNFKNLYLPEPREGGVPRFMGNAGAGSKRAWQLDFRSAAVREKNGGSGVVLLSATPAKNSPLEFYNLIQYVDHDVWARQGIRDPEQFIDRYLRIELKPVVDSKMEVVERSAVTGFQNLHELRDTLFRYGEFKTAEDVGLNLPEPTVSMVEVDMDARQSAKYGAYVAQIEAALDSADDRSQILGLLARMSLTAVHADLDEGYTWRTAAKVEDARSPKFTALAKRVLKNRHCGHIVFLDNVAAHRWVRQMLVDAGIPEKRIAVLNAFTAKASADRQRIAREFNGTDGEPRYDVVIANAIAYEGIDLQTRTCAIHHLDLPWEPATLQQRNGRGVRQGNTLSAIEIVYYFARRSMDGLRFNLIQGKLGWMTELLKSQERATNNPGAQMELGPEEVLLLVSRDPAKTAERLAEVKARREAEARAKVARDAARLLRSADARFRKASRAEDPAEAARLRAEAEERLADLARVDPYAWPWAPWMDAVRRGPMLVPPDGQSPVFEGLRVRVPSLDVLVEFGRVRDGKIGIRRVGEAKWMLASLEDVVGWAFTPADLDPDWVEDVDLDAKVTAALRYTGDWAGLGWTMASDAWVQRAWKEVGGVVIERLASVSGWYAKQQKVPVVNGKLRVTGGSELSTGVVLSPTDTGWARFVKEGAESDLSWSERNACALWWWGRKLPRGGAA